MEYISSTNIHQLNVVAGFSKGLQVVVATGCGVQWDAHPSDFSLL